MTAPFAPLATPLAITLGATHRRRLREVWRSAGWPFQDLLEAELLAAGLLERLRDAQGREALRVTDAGLREIAFGLQRNRAARDAHEALVGRVALEMQRAGRVVWRGLSLRAWVAAAAAPAQPATASGDGAEPAAQAAAQAAMMAARAVPTPAEALNAGLLEDVEGGGAEGGGAEGGGAEGGGAEGGGAEGGPGPAGGWVMAMPDVYSIRHTTREDRVEPAVHEIKVSRADLLSDLRRPAKAEAYRWMGGECWYVIREGIAQPEEIPPLYGVMLALRDGRLEVARPAPRRAMRLPFAIWMALARAVPERPDDDAQAPLR